MNNFEADMKVQLLKTEILELFGKGEVYACFCTCLSSIQKKDFSQLEENRRRLYAEKERFLSRQELFIPEQALKCEHLMERMDEALENLAGKSVYRSKKVFLVHGRDEQMKRDIKTFFYEIGFEPVILSEQVSGGKTVIEKFEEYAEQAAFAAVLLSPDDEGGLRTQTARYPRARQNVILELGYFIGRLGRLRVLLFRSAEEAFEEPSDISGYCFINYGSNAGWKIEAAQNIANLGYAIDISRIKI